MYHKYADEEWIQKLEIEKVATFDRTTSHGQDCMMHFLPRHELVKSILYRWNLFRTGASKKSLLVNRTTNYCNSPSMSKNRSMGRNKLKRVNWVAFFQLILFTTRIYWMKYSLKKQIHFIQMADSLFRIMPGPMSLPQLNHSLNKD